MDLFTYWSEVNKTSYPALSRFACRAFTLSLHQNILKF